MKIIPWSGGADSTLLVAHTLRSHDVLAMTLVHPQLHKPQEECEERARSNFKKWLQKDDLARLTHITVTVKTDAHVHDGVGQPGLWFCHLMPYVQTHDEVLFAYIRGDDFWHTRHLFTKAFSAISCNHLSGSIRLTFPFEWNTKADVVRGLKRYKTPKRCWWTCDSPRSSLRACGGCIKCVHLRIAKDDEKMGRFSNADPIDPLKRLVTAGGRRLKIATEHVKE